MIALPYRNMSSGGYSGHQFRPPACVAGRFPVKSRQWCGGVYMLEREKGGSKGRDGV